MVGCIWSLRSNSFKKGWGGRIRWGAVATLIIVWVDPNPTRLTAGQVYLMWIVTDLFRMLIGLCRSDAGLIQGRLGGRDRYCYLHIAVMVIPDGIFWQTGYICQRVSPIHEVAFAATTWHMINFMLQFFSLCFDASFHSWGLILI